jgi:hypothetical protein
MVFKRGVNMRTALLALCVLLIMACDLFAGEIIVPAGTIIDGTTMFGTFAPAETATIANFSLSVKASRNPVGVDGREIPLKDCVIMGDVVADVTVNRVFFKASKIICSNAKEPGGSPIKGYLVDDKDNKLGIQGVPPPSAPTSSGTPAPAATSATQRFVEARGGAKVTFYILEGIIISTK